MSEPLERHRDSDQETGTFKPIIVPTYKEKQAEKKSWLQKKKQAKKERQRLREQNKSKKKERLLSQTAHILPFLDIDDEHILCKDFVMDIFQVESRDLQTYNEESLKVLIYSQARYYRSYFDTIKIIAMNFPSNTEKQKAYWNRKKEKTDDPLRLKYIERKLFEFNYLEKERSNREFFLFVYADDKDQLMERKKEVVRLMQHVFPLKRLSINKKEHVLFMLNNQNTRI